MTDKFVPYEIAVLAREKGFDEPCFGYFTDTECKLFVDIRGEDITNSTFGFYPTAPLYLQLVGWFYLKGLDISVAVSYSGKFTYTIWTINEDAAKGWKRGNGNYGYETRELGYQKAFEEAFKLLT